MIRETESELDLHQAGRQVGCVAIRNLAPGRSRTAAETLVVAQADSLAEGVEAIMIAGRICRKCGKKFNPELTGDRVCAACRTRRNKQTKDPETTSEAPEKSQDYPGAEWAPLPDDLLIKISAHVLARDYVAWAGQRKAN